MLAPDGSPTDITSAAVVPWWSFTKTLIAACALILARSQRVTLDAPLPGLPYTLRQLLQHTAGVGNYGGMEAYHAAVARADQPWSQDELFARVPAEVLQFEPGRGWAYSNVGYLVARRTIEDAYGASLNQVLRDLVLGPLGLHASRLAHTPEDMLTTSFVGGHGYHPGWVYHGSVIGPVLEAARALHGILCGELLSPAEREAMQATYPVGGAIPGRPWLGANYGLGLMIGPMRDAGMTQAVTVLGHSAGGPGSVGAIYHAPHSGRTAAVFAGGEKDEGVAEYQALRFLV